MLLFCVGRSSYISFTTRWEVSLVSRNTITHGGCVGPATQKVTFNCQNLRTLEVQNRKSGVDFLLDSLTNFESVQSGVRSCSIPVRFLFEVEPEVDVQMLCRPVVVVQTRCRCSGASSLFCCSCSLFVVLLFE